MIHAIRLHNNLVQRPTAEGHKTSGRRPAIGARSPRNVCIELAYKKVRPNKLMVRPENKKMKCGHNRNVQRSTNDIDVQGKIISFFRFHLDKVWTTIDQGTRFVVGVPFITSSRCCCHDYRYPGPTAKTETHDETNDGDDDVDGWIGPIFLSLVYSDPKQALSVSFGWLPWPRWGWVGQRIDL
ncbi:hypothetical protein [Absidia glauca]|uniref:Uncharacterized protein n=1 Tax=Absidia glauca TaxID=4829 RepID=A0A168M1S8_ABSGL|nr:hypothetical protein [Absidia glauca]